MKKEPISTENAPSPSGSYSQAIRAGDFLYLSGQGPFSPDGASIEGSFASKTRQVFKNINQIVQAAGFALDDAVKINVYLESMSDFDTMDEIYRELIPRPFPTRTTIECGLGGIGIEVDVVLWRSESQ